MALPPDVLDLIRRARSGDEAAWTELVHGIQPFIHRVARIRLRRHGRSDEIRHDLGSLDVCQSIFRSLFQGLQANRYRFDQPQDLEKLLYVMVRFNVMTKARRSSVKLRKLIEDFEQGGWIHPGAGPDEEVAGQDLVEVIQEQFSEEELEILLMWLDEVPWMEIGRKVGCPGDTARMRLNRAVARVKERMAGGDHREA